MGASVLVGSVGGLALAGAFLLATHFGVSSTRLRPLLVDRIGVNAYLSLYSLVSAVAFAWLVAAYGGVPYVKLWDWAPWQGWAPLLLMPVALLLVIGGLTVRSPTSVGQEKALHTAEPARGLLRVTRHPFLWGVTIWAAAHLPPNGDVGSLIFFGTLGALGLVGAMLIDGKRRAALGLDWERFEKSTSFVPFAAVVRGQQSLARAAAEFGLIRLAAVAVLYGLILHLHPVLFGVPAIPR